MKKLRIWKLLLLGLLLCLGQLQLHILKLIFLLGSLDA